MHFGDHDGIPGADPAVGGGWIGWLANQDIHEKHTKISGSQRKREKYQ